MGQAFVTVVIPFEAARAQRVEARIDAVLGNPVLPAVRRRLRSSGVVHFMSLVVVPGQGGARANLILEASVDGTRESGIAVIASALSGELTDVLACAGLPEPNSLEDLLGGHACRLGSGWFDTLGLEFAGTPGMSAQRIRAEDRLARRMQAILQGLPVDLPPYERLQEARQILWQQGWAKWAFRPEPAVCLQGAPDTGITPLVGTFFGDAIPKRPFDPLLALHTVGKIVGEAVAAFAWPWLLLALLLLVLASCLTTVADALVLLGALSLLVGLAVTVRLRHLELANTPVDREPGSKDVSDVMRHESFTAQNLLFSVSTLQAGLLRRMALRLSFFSVGLARYFCRPGFLGGNRVIHFARWMLVPGTDQMIFLSNYDGTWQGYVGDFVINTAGAKGVTSIWSNCLGFPLTRTLFDAGAADRDRLVRWARRQQRPVHFWFSAYPRVTTDRVRINAAIRQGIASAQTEQDAQDWLACFGSAPLPPAALDTSEIPAMAFGGLSKLKHACMIGVQLDAQRPAQGRAWLRAIESRVSYGEHWERQVSLAVGLSASGLRKLGLHDDEDMATFPVAFQQGMDAQQRARANGDEMDQSPSKWRWGHDATSVDAVVLLYAHDAHQLRAEQLAVLGTVTQFGHTPFIEQAFKTLPPDGKAVEAFGFVDGVSQPAMRGTRRGRTVEAHEVVEPGEIVLGYADQLALRAPSPTLRAACDPHHLLGDAGLDPLRQRPLFGPGDASLAPRDFGRNGTFLVVRELKQDVDAFDAWLKAQAPKLQGTDVPQNPWQREEWLAAKLVGRWRDGSSLLRHPHAPAGGWQQPYGKAKPDNAFRYGEEDPGGEKCPLGAHIRRANPRDGLVGVTPEGSAAVQTHRLLRVGRSYEDGKERGLMFMCVNADIERQFEFVQQRWVLNPSFEGMDREPDALLGQDPARGHSIPGCPARRVTGFEPFVTMRGGGYFFLPSRAALRVLAQ